MSEASKFSSPPMISVPVATEKYVAELDGIRAVAVGLVVFSHYGAGAWLPGGFGVTLFFFLSGYLITTLFYAEYGSTRQINIPKFYLRRWLRLTPPLLILVGTAALYYLSMGQRLSEAGVMAALLYYMNYYMLCCGAMDPRFSPLVICWSLAVEEHFYLAWPWLLRSSIKRAEYLCMVVAALCIAVLTWRTIGYCFLGLSDGYTYLATDCRIDSILYGALLRGVFETRWGPALVALLHNRICRAAAFFALLMTVAIRDDVFRSTLRYTIQGLSLMPIFTGVLLDDPRTLARRVLSSRPMVLVGRLSYSVYLFHVLGISIAETYFGSSSRLVSAISGLGLTSFAAYLIFITVEKPIGRIRHRLRRMTARSSPAMLNETAAKVSAAPLRE